MHRTNIYLDDEQCAALDEMAADRHVSRSELIRHLIDAGLGRHSSDLEADLIAIDESFGVLADEDLRIDRGRDARSRHLEKIARTA
jgi:metal-responsive CopG/Arc/MetJ family transcriptional regulator